MRKVRVRLGTVKSKLNSLKRLKLLHQESVLLESQQEVDAAITVIMEEDMKPSDKEAGIGDYVSPRNQLLLVVVMN